MRKRHKLLASAAIVALGILSAWWFFAGGAPHQIAGSANPLELKLPASRPAEVQPAIGLAARTAAETDATVSLPSNNVETEPFREVRLLVTDRDLVPLEGAMVQWTSAAKTGTSATDQQGECRLRVDGDSDGLQLEITCEGFARLSSGFGYRPRLSVWLTRTLTLRGSVLDATTRAGVEGARVSAGIPNCKNCQVSAVSGPDGRYELAGAPDARRRWGGKPAESMHLSVEAPGYPRFSTGFTIDATSDTDHLDFYLPSGVPLRGRIVDFVTGAGLAGATASTGSGDVSTDASGAFDGRFLADEGGNLILRVTAPNRCRLIVKLAHQEIASGDVGTLRLPESPIFAGVVRDPLGKPIAGAHLAEGDNSRPRPSSRSPLSEVPDSWGFEASPNATSDAAGSYSITGLVPWTENRAITAWAPGFLKKDMSIAGAPGPGELVNLDFQLERRVAAPGCVVWGRVYVDGWEVPATVGWEAAGRSGEQTFDAGNGYRFRGLTPVKHTLRARVAGLGQPLEGGTVELDLLEGGELRHDFNLVLPMGYIRGTVHFEDGSPARGVRVGASFGDPDSGLGQLGEDGISGADGRFELKLPDLDTALNIEARLGAMYTKKESVRLGCDDLQLVIPASGELLLRVLDARTLAPLPLTSWLLLGQAANETSFHQLGLDSVDVTGWISIELKAGPVDLMVRGARSGHLSASRKTSIVRGTTTREEFLLEPGLHVQFRFDPPADSDLKSRRIYVLEPEHWSAVRAWVDLNGSQHTETDPSFPPRLLWERALQFDGQGLAKLNCLGPGKYRFKALPGERAVDPETIELTDDTSEPIVLSWKR